MVTVLAKRSYDHLLREPCFVCSVQTGVVDTTIKLGQKTLPCSETAVVNYYKRIYKDFTVYYENTYNTKKYVYRHV